MAQDEQVLVFEQKILAEAGTFHGLKFDVDGFMEKLFEPGVLRFMRREDAEKDPTFKQLIPYVIMTYGGKYLSYVRGKRAGETRLVGNRSIGIGGHINPIDNPLFGMKEMYLTAVEREVEEEVDFGGEHTDRILGLLNDDSNEVGSVHLGVVHLWELDSDKVTRKEQMITQMSFMTLEELVSVRDSMETWSALCVDGLDKMA